MASAMRVMIILVIISAVSASVQARDFPVNRDDTLTPSPAAAMKDIIRGVYSHARNRFVSKIYGDYKYVRSTNTVGRPEGPSPPPPQPPPGSHPGYNAIEMLVTGKSSQISSSKPDQ